MHEPETSIFLDLGCLEIDTNVKDEAVGTCMHRKALKRAGASMASDSGCTTWYMRKEENIIYHTIYEID